MQEYSLSFGVFYDLGDGIAEAIVDEGFEVCPEHLHELIGFVQGLESRPRGLLANRCHSYSFSFDAMQMVAGSDVFAAVAVLRDGRRAPFVPLSLWPKFFRLGFFDDRQKALDWLRDRLGPSVPRGR